MPLAIGYKRSLPETPVIAFTGDAGLEMVLGELATLRDCGEPVIVLVFVDESLALIELKQRGVGHANAGVDFASLDYAAIGRSLGGHGVTVRSRAELATALEAAFAAERFTVIGCKLERHAYDGRI